ncbi:MAG: hypothetical protein R2762_14190 [Bryobacteraceae bacterium]
MANTLQDPSILAAALEGLELQKARIEEQIRTVKAMLGGKAPKAAAAEVSAPAEAPAAKAPRKRRRNKLSAEARARIAEAQKKRWANFRKATKK